jgi:hypothetical protein
VPRGVPRRPGPWNAPRTFIAHPQIPVTAGPTIVAIGQAVETDTAAAFAYARIFHLGLIAPSDLLAPSGSLAPGSLPAPETDTAQPVTAAHLKPIGQATETDTAQPAAHARGKIIGQPSETDSATAAGHARVFHIGQAVETDSATAMLHARADQLAQPVEVDTALPITAARVHPIGQPSESDTAAPVAHARAVTIGQAQETDSAGAMVLLGPQTVTIGQALEVDTAGQIFITGGVSPAGPDVVFPSGLGSVAARPPRPQLRFPQRVDIGLAEELNIALPITVRKVARNVEPVVDGTADVAELLALGVV